MEKEKKPRKHVYRVRDFFVLPLIIGMAFTKEKDPKELEQATLETTPDGLLAKENAMKKQNAKTAGLISLLTLQVADSINEVKETPLVTLEREQEERRMDQFVSASTLVSLLKEELQEIEKIDAIEDFHLAEDPTELEVTKATEIEEMSQDVPDTMNDDGMISFSEEEITAFQEANTWMEESNAKETVDHLEETLADVELTFQDQERLSQKKDEMRDLISAVKDQISNQNQELEALQRRFQAMEEQAKETVRTQKNATASLFTSILLLRLLAEKKMNRFVRFFLEMSVMTSLFRVMARDRAKEEVDVSSFVQELSSMESQNDEMQKDLYHASKSTEDFLKDFEKTYSEYRDQIPNYDEILDTLKKATENLEKQAAELEEQSAKVRENSQKILEKKYS